MQSYAEYLSSARRPFAFFKAEQQPSGLKMGAAKETGNKHSQSPGMCLGDNKVKGCILKALSQGAASAPPAARAAPCARPAPKRLWRAARPARRARAPTAERPATRAALGASTCTTYKNFHFTRERWCYRIQCKAAHPSMYAA